MSFCTAKKSKINALLFSVATKNYLFVLGHVCYVLRNKQYKYDLHAHFTHYNYQFYYDKVLVSISCAINDNYLSFLLADLSYAQDELL